MADPGQLLKAGCDPTDLRLETAAGEIEPYLRAEADCLCQSGDYEPLEIAATLTGSGGGGCA